MRNMLSGQGGLGYTYIEPDKEVIVMNEKGSIIHDKTNGEIIITDNYAVDSSFDYRKKIVIADKNLGATKVWNEGDPFDEEHCGKWYQWGNNYGFPYNPIDIRKVSTTKVNVDSYNEHPSTYSSDTWISVTDGARMEEGISNYGFGIWGDQQDFLSRKGPCPSGWHLPHKYERLALKNELARIFGYSSGSYGYISLDLMNLILSPYDGYLLGDKTIAHRDLYSEFWGCDNDNTSPVRGAQFLMAKQVSDNRIAVRTPTHYKAQGLHIRPFKNIYDGVMTLQQLEALGTPDLIRQELNEHKGEYLDVYGFSIKLCLSNYEYEFYTNLNGAATYPQWFYQKVGACS